MIGVVDTSALIRLFIPDGPVPGGYNALFLALALENNAVFFTADHHLARAAEALHLAVNS